MIPIEPMMIGAAAAALPRVVEALPKPGEFVGMLREAITAVTSPGARSSENTSVSDRSFEAQKQQAHGGLLSGSLKQQLNEAISQFRDAIGRLFEENGIDPSPEIRLSIDSFGQARVEGTRADAGQIEALFEQNPQLRNQLASIQAISGVLNAARRSAEFRQAYDVDAAARFGDLRSDKSTPQSTVVIGADSFDILFE